MRARSVHCWTLRPVVGVDGWDPDRDPGRFADAFGHAIVELVVRLRRRGRVVTIGPVVPPRTDVVVVLLEELVSYDGHVRPAAVSRLARDAFRRPVVVVRADVPLGVVPPAFVRTQVMPNRTAIVDGRAQRWVPLLPQRGLVPRDPGRGHTIHTLTCKGFEFNVPAELRAQRFLDAIAGCGVHFALDGDPATWPDFRHTDVALCVRRHNDAWDDRRHLRKPATKLVNAWVAGAIPLVAPQAAYLELVRPGEDALVVEGPDGIIAAMLRLRGDRVLVRRLQAGGAERAREFSVDCVLDAWEELLDGDLERAPVTTTTAAVVTYGARAGARRARRQAGVLVGKVQEPSRISARGR